MSEPASSSSGDGRATFRFLNSCKINSCTPQDKSVNEPRHEIHIMWHFDKCRLSKPVQPTFKLRNSKLCSVSSLIVNIPRIFK